MHINHQIYSIPKIEAEARKAAHEFVAVNDACPYPFGGPAARVFTLAFLAERNHMLLTPTSTATQKT